MSMMLHNRLSMQFLSSCKIQEMMMVHGFPLVSPVHFYTYLQLIPPNSKSFTQTPGPPFFF